jgi:hypothetical protein
MEEDVQKAPLKSSFLYRGSIQKELKRLEDAIDQADDILHYETAHNPELLYATDIVENFLRRKRRVCYGGTAINAILPETMKLKNLGICWRPYSVLGSLQSLRPCIIIKPELGAPLRQQTC